MKGIDVSYAQGKVDWERVKAGGTEFVMIKASQGRLIRNPNGKPFTDPRFLENVKGACRVGLHIGVYHYLTASDTEAAIREAEYFLSVITPHKDKITLWACCDTEEDRYLPKGRSELTGVVHAFLKKVRTGGFTPMLYTNPNYLKYKLLDVSMYPLWLAYWNASEARALAYNPKVWKYGIGRAEGVNTRVDLDRGYFNLPETEILHENGNPSGEAEQKGESWTDVLKRKLSSRKLWAAVLTAALSAAAALMGDALTEEILAALRCAAATCVAYIFGEGAVDAARALRGSK